MEGNIEKEVLKKIGELTLQLQDDTNNVDLLVERGKLYLKLERRDLALNDFNAILKIDKDHVEADSYILLITAIDDYFYNQTYNV